MSLSAIWKLGTIVLPGPVTIKQITDSTINSGIEWMLVKGDGKIAPQFGAVVAQKPSLSFTSTALKTVIDEVTYRGKGYSATITAYMLKKAAAAFDSGSNHATITAPKGLIVPRTLRAAQGQPATIDCDLFFISSDGTTAAIAYAGSVAFPTIPLSDQAYVVGPGSINGSAVGAIDSIEVTFGIREKVLATSGEIWPTFACVDTQVAQLKIVTHDPAILTTVPPAGVGVTASSYVYLRKKAFEGGNVANSTAEHIKISVASAGMLDPSRIQQGDESDTTIEVTWQPLDDGSTDLVAFNTAAAIA